MSETQRVKVEASGCLVNMLEILLFVAAVWWALGGFTKHCQKYASASACTAVYGPGGPHADKPTPKRATP